MLLIHCESAGSCCHSQLTLCSRRGISQTGRQSITRPQQSLYQKNMLACRSISSFKLIIKDCSLLIKEMAIRNKFSRLYYVFRAKTLVLTIKVWFSLRRFIEIVPCLDTWGPQNYRCSPDWKVTKPFQEFSLHQSTVKQVMYKCKTEHWLLSLGSVIQEKSLRENSK